MQIPLSWIKKYLSLEQSPQEIADLLTMAGLEVDAILDLSLSCEGVVAARVEKVEPHPNADQLTLAVVNDGKEEHRVVCGAPNCEVGLVTAFAPIGAVLHDETGKKTQVKAAKIRGEESSGMLCSEKEIQLRDNHDGILDLSKDLPLGTDLAAHFSEIAFDISLTPNLAHCQSVLGVVRELSALSGVSFKEEKYLVKEGSPEKIEDLVEVEVQEKELCPRYACRLIKGIKVVPSPIWLQRKLVACGLRPINNIVDITNYVLMERGQPLHAFDFSEIQDGKVIVRKARNGEELTTLDGEHRKIPEGALLIADPKGPLAVAGVIGGLHSEVKDLTTDILIESAYFEPVCIRKTSKVLSLQTDASKRFERGCDPNNVVKALDQVVSLITEIAGGECVTGLIDQKIGDFPERVIRCRVSRVNHILGSKLSVSEVENVFQRLSFPSKWEDENTLAVTIPTYRVDLEQEIDLIEEVARMVGYEHFLKGEFKATPSQLEHAPIFVFERETRNRLLSEGLQELLTSDLISPTAVKMMEGAVPKEDILTVLNPTSIEQSVLRPDLLPTLLQVLKFNRDRQVHHLSGFEVGRVHLKDGEGYKEQSVVGIIMTGNACPNHWERKGEEVDFYDLKGIVENLLSGLDLNEVTFERSNYPSHHPGRQASILVKGKVVGTLGQVHPRLAESLDLTKPVFYAECNLHDLIQLREAQTRMEPLPQYPSSKRDATITLTESIPVKEVFQAVEKMEIPLLKEVEMIDLYYDEKLGSEKKKVTFRFVYRDAKKTVTQQEVDAAHSTLLDDLLAKLGKAAV